MQTSSVKKPKPHLRSNDASLSHMCKRENKKDNDKMQSPRELSEKKKSPPSRKPSLRSPSDCVVDVVICEKSVTYSGHASVLLGCLAQLRCLSHFHLHSSHFLFVQSSSEARISNPIISFGPLASPRDFHVSVREGKEGPWMGS